MGRSKVVIRSIDDAVKRKATFQKRKVGVMKKAMEISVLCHCDVALVMFDEHGNLFQFASKDMRTTLKRAFAHKGRKETKTNETLLRTHGVTKDRVEQTTEKPLGHQINYTPAASCGLDLSADSFGTLLKGVDQPASPPSCFPPSSPEHDSFDVFDMPPDCLTGELKKPAAPAAAPKFQQALPPKVQRSVDRLMRDISLMHKAGELIHDPFVMSTANLNGSCGTFDVKPAFHVQRPTIC
jgi:hypothetical protein